MFKWKLRIFIVTILTILSFYCMKAENINAILDLQLEKYKNRLLEYDSKVLEDNECFSTYYYLFENWNQSDTAFSFLIKLFDSSSKLQSGITGYNLFDLGNFDICYNLEANFDMNLIYGKYCLTDIPISFSSYSSNGLITEKVLSNKFQPSLSKYKSTRSNDTTTIIFQHAFCLPSVCSAEDMNKLVEYILDDYSFLPKPIFSEEMCYSKQTSPELTAGAIFTIAFLSVIAIFIIFSSVYEYYLLLNGKEPVHEILIAFSLITNVKKLIKSSKNPDHLLCLNGIKAISMAWVIIGHEFELYQQGPIENAIELQALRKDKWNMWLTSGTLSVDSFFAVGGLVTVYAFMKSSDKGVPFNIPLYYLHRYLRLTPVLAVLILIFANLLKYLGNGPLWYNIEPNYMADCGEYWWSTLLYIQNYVNLDNQCIVQTWYLSVDFQIFILSPCVLYFLTRKPKLGYSLLGLLNVLGFVVPTAVSYYYNLCAFYYVDDQALYDKGVYYYYQTHSRFGPYVIGMTFGTIIYKMKRNKAEPRKTSKNIKIALCLWLVALGGLFGSTYGGISLVEDCNRISNAFFNGFYRNTWSISLGLLILLCVSGFGGPIDSFLSLAVFQFITKLSYSMYLLHYVIIAFRMISSRTPLHFSHLTTIHIFWADFITTMALSFIFCLCFESPIIILEKYLLGGLMGNSKKNNHQKSNVKNSNL